MNRQEGARNQPKKFFKEILKNPLTTNAEYGKLSTESKGWHSLRTPKKLKKS